MSQSELPQSWQLPPPEAPSIGGGRYRLANRLGEGGMATVYRAWDVKDEAWVAVKVLLPEFARKRKLRKRFENEGRTMLGFDHRNIIRVLDVSANDEPLPFIVMEIADGGCVIDWIERYGPMPPRMAVDVIMQACKGLKAAHEQKIVHRDVKPHNILITRRGRCQLTDFGIAQLDEANGMTKTGSVMGTMGYMAPEQRNNSKGVDERADIYGLGASLFKLLTAGPVEDLFLAEHDAEILDGVPAPLVPVLIKATAYKPEHRYQSVVELAQELHAAKQDLPTDPEDAPPLPLTYEESKDGVPTLSELSEPTFSEVPPELANLPLDRRAIPGPSPVASHPSSNAGIRSVTQAETIDLPAASEQLGDPRSVLPYQMPTSHERNEDPDYIPDYVDRDSLPGKRETYEVELDEESKKRAEAAFRRAVELGRIDENGILLVDPNAPLEDRTKNFWSPLEDILGLTHGAIQEILSIILRPLQVVIVVGTIFTVIGGLTIGTWGSTVKAAQVDALSARTELYRTIDDNKAVIADLDALGGDAVLLESFWFDYEKAEGGAKVDAAIKVVNRAEAALTHARQFGKDLRQSKLQLAHERINRMKLAVSRHESAMLVWAEVADDQKGRTAIRFGAASPPDI